MTRIAVVAETSIPVSFFRERHLWGPTTYVVLQEAFGVQLGGHDIRLSEEHTEFRWVAYEDGIRMLRWDSNKIALWELHQRVRRFCGEADPAQPSIDPSA